MKLNGCVVRSMAEFRDEPDRLHRVYLVREFSTPGPRVCFLMVNPSKATEFQDDPTVSKCARYALGWGFGSYSVVNLFSFRATDPADMRAAAEPNHPENDRWILSAVDEAVLTVCAWGENGLHRGRAAEVLDFLRGRELHCLRVNASGMPAHPLYLPGSLPPSLYRAA